MRPTAVAAYEDFTQNRPSVAPDISRSPARVRLIPPPQPLLKVNFDGAVFNEDRKAGVMIVIRNCLGQVMTSMTHKCNLPTSVDEVEAMAAVRAVVFAQELGFSSIILEGNSEKIMNTFKNDEPSFASYGHLIKETKFLAVSFVVFSVFRV